MAEWWGNPLSEPESPGKVGLLEAMLGLTETERVSRRGDDPVLAAMLGRREL